MNRTLLEASGMGSVALATFTTLWASLAPGSGRGGQVVGDA